MESVNSTRFSTLDVDWRRIEENERLRQAVELLLGYQRTVQNRHQILKALRKALGQTE
jgi:hypothetical protein